MQRNLLTLISILILTAVSFILGTRDPINTFLLNFSAPTPPTNSTIYLAGQSAPIESLDLTVNQALHISQPNYPLDLAIIEVSFSASSDCSPDTCQFQRKNFSVQLPSGKTITPAAYPQQYIPNIKLTHLAPQRQLSRNARETGQIYFLIPKESLQLILEYDSTTSPPVQFQLQLQKI